MMFRNTHTAAVLAIAAAMTGSASADFAGQTILGPLSAGSVVNGDTTGHADDNDGFDSGFHFFDVWTGGDDVWALNWGGGDLTVTLINTDGFGDNDLFVYVPGSLDSTEHYSLFPGNVPDVVTIFGAAAGTYYINVDSAAFMEGSYQLSVGQVPAPGAGALLAAAALGVGRRRRR